MDAAQLLPRPSTGTGTAAAPLAGLPHERTGWSPRVGVAVTAAMAVLWLILDPRTADLAAAVYRARLFARAGFALWDNAWFGGHHLLGYSLVFPALSALAGPRVVGACSVVASAALFAHLARRHAWPRAELGAIWFGLAVGGDLFIGRLTFALGVALALGAVVAWSHDRALACVALSCGAAAASPVVGLFLVLVAVAGYAVLGRAGSVRIGVPALITAVVLAFVFPEGGNQPYDLSAALWALAITVAVAACVDQRWRSPWLAMRLYAVAIVLAFLVPSPMGSNIARLGVLFAGPLLLGATRDVRRPLVIAACSAIAFWQLWGPTTEVLKATDNPAVSPSYSRPLLAYLSAAGAADARIEVVPTSTRWEAVYIARRFALARGWETQLDRRYNTLFYRGRLTAGRYRHWLDAVGVRLVALPDSPLDRWAQAEGRLVRSRPAFLRLVWHSRHWQVFSVEHPISLVNGPGRLVDLRTTSFTVVARHAGAILVRVRFTSFWHVHGPGCVAPGPAGWTLLRARRPGTIRVSAAWSWASALQEDAPCAPSPVVPARATPR